MLLDAPQRELVSATIIDHCRRREWTLLALAVLVNHIHVVVASDRPGGDVRDQLKAWCSRRLSDAAGACGPRTTTGGRRRWFTEGAFVSQIEDEAHLTEVVHYVENQ